MPDDYLAHHGIKGQKWGVRRYQNSDGSLTDAGKKHYGYGLKKYDSIHYDWSHQNASMRSLGRDKQPFSDDPEDFVIKKGSNVYRVSKNQRSNIDGNRDRLYVHSSGEKSSYNYDLTSPKANREIQQDMYDSSYVNSYKTKRNITVAGKETINKLLKEVGEKPLSELYDWSNNMPIDSLTDRDFMMGRSEHMQDVSAKVISKAKEHGYDAIMDPMDSNIGRGYDPSAMIIINNVLEQYGSKPLWQIDPYW